MQVVHWYATLLKLYGYIIPPGTRAGAVGWGTALQAGGRGGPRVRFPIVSFEFFIYIILPAALWPRGWLNL